jgi:hypothetical protein
LHFLKTDFEVFGRLTYGRASWVLSQLKICSEEMFLSLTGAFLQKEINLSLFDGGKNVKQK